MEGSNSLCSLPVDILGEILNHPTCSYLVIALMKCGNARLNLLLSSAVTYLDLKDTRLASTSRYPKLISSLKKLRHLSLDRGEYSLMSSTADLLFELTCLEGSKLEKLSVISAEVPPLFDAGILACINSKDSDTPLMDLATSFPTLRSLTLTVAASSESPTVQENGLPPSGDGLRNNAFSAKPRPCPPLRLPPSLTLLDIPPVEVRSDSFPLFGSLPRTLKHWRSPIFLRPDFLTGPPVAMAGFSKVFDDAPFGIKLECLSGGAIIDKSLASFEFLPRNCDPSGPLLTGSLEREHIQSLPPTTSSMDLRHVSRNQLSGHWILDLPPQLTSLSVMIFESNGFFSSIPSLPRTLTHLKVFLMYHETPFCDWTLVEEEMAKGNDFWPPALSKLELDTECIPYPAFKLLPSTLTELRCWLNSSTINFPLNPNLKVLTLNADMRSLSFNVKGAFGAHGGTLAPGTLPSLESSLTSLVINSKTCTITALPNFANLTSLVVPTWKHSQNSNRCLPKTLTSLIVNTHFEGLPEQPQPDEDAFSFMPAGLRVLQLSRKSENDQQRLPVYPAKCFSNLTQLEVLELTSIAWFEAGVLEHLRRLKSLKIGLVDLDEDSARCINPFLLKLELGFQAGPKCFALAVKNWPPAARAPGSDRIFLRALARSRMYPDPRVLQ